MDADAQRSSSVWLSGVEPPVRCQVLQSADDLLEQIPELHKECDRLIVDGPASLAEETRAILFRTDLAVIPVQPTGVDLRSAFDVLRLIKQAQSVREGYPKAAVFLNRAVKGTKLKTEAINLLSQNQELTMLKSAIHQRQAIADASGQSATVWEMSGVAPSESAKEYERLFKEIVKLLP